MLCGAVIGGIEGKGKEKARDDETKEAAVQCLSILLQPRSEQDALARAYVPAEAEKRLFIFQENAQSTKFVPILGQTLDSILAMCTSRQTSLQRVSLHLLHMLVERYAPDYLIPSILPGVASVMTKVSLGTSTLKSWVNGDIVAGALKVMAAVVIKSIGDDICIKEGALRHVQNLEDLGELEINSSSAKNLQPYATPRTSSWLRGTATQIHIAINTLTPLVSHPTPSAAHAFIEFSASIIIATPRTLPQTQPLLLSFLLSLSNSAFHSVSLSARNALLDLLSKSSSSPLLIQRLILTTGEHLNTLPRLLSAQDDAKVEHVAGIIVAVCRLAVPQDEHIETIISPVSKGIAKLLGPNGGIEKWGWSLLSVLELVEPTFATTHVSSGQLTFESDSAASQFAPFPSLVFKNISLHSTREALERMFNALGRAGGDSSLFAVEWFINVGRTGNDSISVTAMWCACRLLEGLSEVSLSVESNNNNWKKVQRSRRLEQITRASVKIISESWDSTISDVEKVVTDDNDILVQHQKGVVPLYETLKIIQPNQKQRKTVSLQPILHKSLCLQFIAVTGGVLQAKFSSLLIYVLYPILHSLVSSTSFLSSTALSTMHFITMTMSFASPGNLLLSNFDYALDAVSRRLTRRWLDVDATKVLVVLIHLVGSDIVDRARDVVEECFDRLDEFHGYAVIVEGVIEVLSEVIKVIESDNTAGAEKMDIIGPKTHDGVEILDEFSTWFKTRNDNPVDFDTTDYGPAPHKAWGNDTEESAEQEDNHVPLPDLDAEKPPTPVQRLTEQIITRSIYFLTHSSPVIRARILTVLTLAVPVLPESTLLPSIHSAWPFILNRITDTETFVVSAASSLVEGLADHHGSFMFRRIWDDIWPRFRVLLGKLDDADSVNALARRGYGSVGTESAYTHSHRIYRAILKTMTAAFRHVRPHDTSTWQVILAFRRFLGKNVQDELQQCAIDLYITIGKKNPDAVWLALVSTVSGENQLMAFLRKPKWDICANTSTILRTLT